jgi:hypothetical protein
MSPKFSNQSEFLAFIEQRRAALAEIRKDHDRDHNNYSKALEEEVQGQTQPDHSTDFNPDQRRATESDAREKPSSYPRKSPKPGRPNASQNDARAQKSNRANRNAWRRDPVVCPGEGYKWTRAGWRKISQRDKDAAVRREARIRANAWKYDQTVNPGEQFYWVNGYSYNRTLKDGTVKRINVRGHWRRRPARTQQFAKAA